MLALLTSLVLGVVLAGPAEAHATLLFANPGIGAAVPQSPPEITLIFDKSVTLAGPPVVLTDGDRHRLPVGSARREQGGRVVVVPVSGHLPVGVFGVHWQVVAADGDTVGGDYRFAVGPTTALTSTASGQGGQSPALLASTMLRWLLFAALALCLGGMVGARVVRDMTGPSPAPSAWTTRAALAGVAAAFGLTGLVAGNGSLWTGLTAPSLGVLGSPPGRLTLLEATGFAATAVLARTRARQVAWAPLLLVVGAEAVRAHPATALPGWGAPLTAAHLLAAATWVGALAQVVRTAVARRDSPRTARAAVGAYARLAAWLFTAVVVTGTASALVLVPWDGWTTTTYGRVLLLKLGLVVVAAGLALSGRYRLRGRWKTSPTPGAAARTERWVLVLVLGVTALLVSLPTPAALAGGNLGLPPPASGVVVPLGARAGTIGVSAAASAGQLVVHLSTPTFTNRAQGQPDRTVYRVSGSAAIDGHARALPWRGCGPGCFVAPLTWGAGRNQVTLTAAADDWPGGTVSLVVPWPPHSGTDELRALASAMAKVPNMTVYERVSSDSRSGPGPVTRLVMSGKAFLGVEPYGSGVAAQAALLPVENGQSALAVGFPGDLTQAELVLDARGRLVRETLTAPYHWVTRTFVYP